MRVILVHRSSWFRKQKHIGSPSCFGNRNTMAIVTMMSAAPTPGRPVRGSTTGRPLMAALDLLGRRWALRVLWELRDGPVGARALRERCDGMSSSVLYDRLGELTDANLIRRDAGGRYDLTTLGESLGAALAPLDSWSKRWSKTLDTEAAPDRTERV
jgi:DNA-binding HxlR family transcriptional regulator